MRNKKFPKAPISRGFTVIELVAVMSIIVIITSVVLFNTNRFNSSILLRSLAYEIGLSLRQAQLYGISTLGNANTFGSSYGIYMTSSMVGASNANATYPLYVDKNQNGTFDPGETVEQFSLREGFYIKDVCTTDAPQKCLSNNISDIAIYFRRPNPNAYISINGAPGVYSGAIITVSSPAGSERVISISSTGQIVIR
jgi:prepilin-type N-terminal cleavage/methylation domain-containing protein